MRNTGSKATSVTHRQSVGQQCMFGEPRSPNEQIPEERRIYIGLRGRYFVRPEPDTPGAHRGPQGAKVTKTDMAEEAVNAGADVDRDSQHPARSQPSRRSPARRRPSPPPTKRPASSLAGESEVTDRVAPPVGISPIERLKRAAAGQEDLLLNDLQRILLDHIAGAYDRIKELDDHASTYLQMLSTPPEKGEKPLDPVVLMSVLDKLEVVRDRRSRELARLAELVYRTSFSPSRLRLQVVAQAAQVNISGDL